MTVYVINANITIDPKTQGPIEKIVDDLDQSWFEEGSEIINWKIKDIIEKDGLETYSIEITQRFPNKEEEHFKFTP